MASRNVDIGDYVVVLRDGVTIKRHIRFEDRPIAIDPSDWDAAPNGFAHLWGLLAVRDEFVCAGSSTDGQSEWAVGTPTEILIRPATVAA